MARVRVRHRLNTSYARNVIGRGNNLRRYMEIRGLAVRSASQQRLRESPRRIDTGHLINSIQTVTLQRRGLPVVRIGTDVEYALYVHEGTSPHIIRSRGAWPLRNRRTGQVFGRIVNHPGMAANPYLVDGLARGFAVFR